MTIGTIVVTALDAADAATYRQDLWQMTFRPSVLATKIVSAHPYEETLTLDFPS